MNSITAKSSGATHDRKSDTSYNSGGTTMTWPCTTIGGARIYSKLITEAEWCCNGIGTGERGVKKNIKNQIGKPEADTTK